MCESLGNNMSEFALQTLFCFFEFESGENVVASLCTKLKTKDLREGDSMCLIHNCLLTDV